jgi:hypothetical protein
MTTSHEVIDEMIMQPGIFELPTPESMESAQQTQRVGGAAQTTWDESDESQQAIPMIVWLRGDEPWFNQFDMDAESVMAALGIKRSRLTQISGKDLRVGRVRMDRYIRPVYRSLDVEQYLKWTRATASHQKSSDAIKIAVDQLQEQSTCIQSTLESISSTFTDSIRNEMASFIDGTVAAGMAPMIAQLNSFQSSMTDLAQQLTIKVTESTEQFRVAAENMQLTLQETTRYQSAAFEVLTLQLNQTSEKAALMEERLSAWDNLLTDNLKAISADLASLKKPERFQKLNSRKLKVEKAEYIDSKHPKLALRAAPSRRKPK